MVKKSKDLYELLARRNPAEDRDSKAASRGREAVRGGGGPNLVETAKGLLGAVGRAVSGTGTPGGAATKGKAAGTKAGSAGTKVGSAGTKGRKGARGSARKPASSLETVARRKGDIRASLPPSGFVVHGPILAGMLLVALVAGFGLGQVVDIGGDAALQANVGGTQPVSPGPVGMGDGLAGGASITDLSAQNLQEGLSNTALVAAIYSAPERARAATAARHLVRNGVTNARLLSLQGHWLVVVYVGLAGTAPSEQELQAVRNQLSYVPDPSNDPVFAAARAGQDWLKFVRLPTN